MARKRLIDPGFFLDEDLAKLSAHARLLYVGCWTIADDNFFTLPHRPDWIKAQIFPYEEMDINKAISELLSCNKFLEFTNGDTKSYLFIPNMVKYQRIDRPSDSKYPCHPEFEAIVKRILGEDSPITQRVLSNASGRALPEVKLSKDKLIEVNTNTTTWNSLMPWKVQTLNDERKRHLSARLEEEGFDMEKICQKILASDFLMGKKTSEKHPNFRADFDWVIGNNMNYIKILEGKYDNRPSKRRSDG